MKKSGKKGKRFNKKNAVKFSLVPRDADDPIANDPKSSKFVLQPVMSFANAETQAKILKSIPQDCLQAEDVDPEPMYKFLPNHVRQGPKYMNPKSAKGFSELPHDYDYSQHMREMGGGFFVAAEGYDRTMDPRMKETKLTNPPARHTPAKLTSKPISPPRPRNSSPSPAAAELTEEKKKSALVDPLAVNDKTLRPKQKDGVFVKATHDFFDALEGDDADYEYEDILDDFVQVALGDNLPEHYKGVEEVVDVRRGKESEGNGQDEKVPSSVGEMDDIDAKILQIMTEGGLGEDEDEDEDDQEEEMRRRRKLDEHFATLYAEFEDENLGELEAEDLEGGREFADYEGVLDAEIAQKKEDRKIQKPIEKKTAEMLKQKIKEAYIRLQEEEHKDIKEIEDEIRKMFKPKVKAKWDCETILTTLSSVSNHPSLITEPRRNAKQIKLSKEGLALEGLPDKKSAGIPEDEHEYEESEPVNFGVRRKKKETKAEKRARKAAAKARKSESRARKKETRKLFKDERKVAVRNTVANQIANPSGIKLS